MAELKNKKYYKHSKYTSKKIEPLRVEGYAFHNNMIGIVHLKSHNTDAYNGYIFQKLRRGKLHDNHIGAFARLRDKESGKKDLPLYSTDGSPRIMFFTIDTKAFSDVYQAHNVVIDELSVFHDVSTKCLSQILLLYYI